MQVTVGTALAYRGNNYICIAIEQFDKVELAKEDSIAITRWARAGENVRHLDFKCEVFEVGDIIHLTGERIMLECPGVDLQFIWVWCHYKKEVVEEEQNDLANIRTERSENSDSNVCGEIDSSRAKSVESCMQSSELQSKDGGLAGRVEDTKSIP